MTSSGDLSASLTASAQPSRTKHLEWIDRTKGMGIILVVIGHAMLGLQSAGLLSESAVNQRVIDVIYSFHMPLFFLLSGYTFERAVRGKPLTSLLKSRVIRLLWPFLVWTYVFILFRAAAGGATNTSTSFAELLQWPLPPKDHFWFLWALFLIQMICLPLARLGNALSGQIYLGLALAIMLGFSLISLPWTPSTVSAGEHLGVFILGVALSRLSPLPGGPRHLMIAGLVFVAVQLLLLVAPQSSLLTVLSAAVLSVAALVLCAGLTRAGMWKWLATLGQLSMVIYLTHTLFTVVTRTILVRFTQDTASHLILGTLAGLVGPILLYHSLRRIAPPRVFGF